MSIGSLHFSEVENAAVEVHAEDAMIWPATSQSTQGSIMILAPKLLQITAERGDLNFSYRDEFQTLPDGQTLRIYLDPRSGPDRTAVAGSQKGAIGKVAYFIVGSGVAAVTGWGVHEAIKSDHAPISPAKP
jgi:hypothetical protein